MSDFPTQPDTNPASSSASPPPSQTIIDSNLPVEPSVTVSNTGQLPLKQHPTDNNIALRNKLWISLLVCLIPLVTIPVVGLAPGLLENHGHPDISLIPAILFAPAVLVMPLCALAACIIIPILLMVDKRPKYRIMLLVPVLAIGVLLLYPWHWGGSN